MNCKSAEALFSDLFDGSLPPAQREQVNAHLAACGSCREGYAAFEGATVALQGSGDRAVGDDDLVARMLAGVDRAVRSENERDEADYRRAMTLVRGDAARDGRRRRVAATVGVMLASAAAAVVVLQLSLGTLSSRTVEVVREQRVEVPVEVPVEVVRERRVEVPVEVPVEVVREVEVPVQVPVEVVREVEVRRGPLVSVDGAALAAAADRLGRRLLSASETLAASLAENAHILADTAERSAPAPVHRTLYDDYRAGAIFEVRDLGGRVTVRSSGRAADLGPLLLKALDSAEREVVDAARARLVALRSRLAGDPTFAAELVEAEGGALTAQDSARSWRAWWAANRALIAARGR